MKTSIICRIFTLPLRGFFLYFNSVLFYFTVISQEKWEHILQTNNLNIMELRDARYNQIVHMVSAANGAEEFYTIEVNKILK